MLSSVPLWGYPLVALCALGLGAAWRGYRQFCHTLDGHFQRNHHEPPPVIRCAPPPP